jgi:hypothetical protein
MANEAGGRLVFCPHTSDGRPGGVQRVQRKEYMKEYRGVRDFGTDYFDGYAALCPCAPGDHFLAPWGPERSSGDYSATATMAVYQFPTAATALAVIEAWQRQQQAQRQAASDEHAPE